MKKINNILLVDDDEVASYINKLIIKSLGLTENIHVALNGEEALNFIKNNYIKDTVIGESCPALVFLDLNMPVMDGFEFLESLKQLKDPDPSGIPIVLLTSSASRKDAERAKVHKISGYIHKPLTEEKVREVVTSIFSNWEEG
jgi:CheY-like chemotaxis protein